MRGIPSVIATNQDWLNVHAYVIAENDEGMKMQLIEKLNGLLASKKVLVPKAGAVPKEAEDGTMQIAKEDFELVDDAQSAFNRAGLTEAKIASMVKALKNA